MCAGINLGRDKSSRAEPHHYLLAISICDVIMLLGPERHIGSLVQNRLMLLLEVYGLLQASS